MTVTLPAQRSALNSLSVLPAGAIDALPWQPVPDCPGVEQKVLWQLGGFTEALIRYAPGATTPGHPHLAAHHHVWVVSGSLTLAGWAMPVGSYAHVPPGTEHLSQAGPDGCVLLQMHRPHPPRELSDPAAG